MMMMMTDTTIIIIRRERRKINAKLILDNLARSKVKVCFDNFEQISVRLDARSVAADEYRQRLGHTDSIGNLYVHHSICPALLITDRAQVINNK